MSGSLRPTGALGILGFVYRTYTGEALAVEPASDSGAGGPGIHSAAHSAQSGFSPSRCSVQGSGGRGYAEWWQYVKYGLILSMAAALLAWKRDAIYVLWCTLAGYLLFDDAFRFHEQVGARIADILPFESIAGLRGQDVGELFVYALVGAVFASGMLLTYVRRNAESGVLLLRTCLFVGALAFFAVGLDMLNIMTGDVRGAILVEDGGEMLVISGMLVMVFDRFYVKLGRRRQAAALPEQRGYASAPSAETSASSTRAR